MYLCSRARVVTTLVVIVLLAADLVEPAPARMASVA